MPKIVKAFNTSLKDNVFISAFATQAAASLHRPDLEPVEEFSSAGREAPASVDEPAALEMATIRQQILDNAHAEAQMIVAESLRKASKLEEEMLSQAKIQAQKLKDEAYQSGLEQGRTEIANQLQYKLDELAALLDRIDDKQREIVDETENDLRLLVIDIVSKIIGKELAEDDKALVGMVKRALSNYKNTDWVKITVSQTDAQTSCITNKKMIAELLDVSGSIEVETIKDASSGLCIVETPSGIADASLQTQISSLKQILMNKNG
ncbi:FliH/SctL family protein [Acetanaerobacterium elongatum]|uniref:FliH/SctL family protein n=1 Tax=Acetanaerobacterium elongatum TaxID=258515 RepID=UPI0013BE9D16|nr:FliH/SctL family protein [Acetanaerobacterium elongatum]